MIQYNNFLMKREQSRAGSRFAECEKSRLKAKILITLALLLTAVTGAWAEEEVLLTTVTPTSHTTYSQSPDGIVTVTLDNIESYSSAWGWCDRGIVTVEAAQGYTITRCVFKQNPNFTPNRVLVDDQAPFTATIVEVNGGEEYHVSAATSTGNVIGADFMNGISSIEVYGYLAEPPIKVTPGEAANTWTFSMPGSDVVLTPQYAPAAQWAKVDNVDQLPTAIEGIYAGTTDAIVNAGAVATGQGTVMYAVTSTNQATAPELSAFSATLPTAENIADEGADVLIWYYIQGADTPDGQEPSAENTFNDSEICTTPLQVTVLTNKYDITLNAANANTIEAGKATVTVGGTAATVTDGKLQGVKMGSEVKLEAKPGYKFRKVEVKKTEAKLPKYADVVKICDINPDNHYLISSFFDGTNANITTITKEEAIALAEYLGGGDIRVVYEEYEWYGDRYARVTNAAGDADGVKLSTTTTISVPLYYVPAGN